MGRIGFHASHELFHPRHLLELANHAARLGFDAGMCSDHFHPWTEGQGHSGFAWSWLGTALQATKASYGTVCAPGQRYHPAVIAQASATLSAMFPGRFWLAVGTGQNLNEHITGDPWPEKSLRQKRLRASVDVIRGLWAGETLTLDTPWFRVDRARLYSRPDRPPLLFGAALTVETAEWVGSWADGLIAVAGETDQLRPLVEAFRRGGGQGKPMHLQAATSWAPSEREALAAAARNWPVAAVDMKQNQDLATPREFDRAVAGLASEDLYGKLRISSDLDRHVAWLRGDQALGFEAIYLHPIGPDPFAMLEVFARDVIPAATSL
jgi:coenzyme F420-dependent glucose-6-phosphate dehydrogenase